MAAYVTVNTTMLNGEELHHSRGRHRSVSNDGVIGTQR
jgi:hypothetical protein